MSSSGLRQPSSAASAAEAPMSFRNVRRLRLGLSILSAMAGHAVQRSARLALVTGDAPAHLKGALAPAQRHLFHRPVAGGAGDPFARVDTVVEVDEVGQGMHAR